MRSQSIWQAAHHIPSVRVSSLRGGCDKGITERTGEDNLALPPLHSHCFVDRPHTTGGTGQSLSSLGSPWHRGTRGRRSPTQREGCFWRPCHSSVSLWREKTRRGGGKVHRAEVSGSFLNSRAPSPSETPRATENKKQFWPLGWVIAQSSSPSPLRTRFLSEWLTLHKSLIYSFVFIKLAGLLYLPSKFSGGAF